jgi:hypothetical protein
MTRANHRAPGHGWHATPGQPIPRAARQPAANGLLLVMLVLVWFSPLSIAAWLLGQAVILLQRRWHWWRFVVAALAAIGVVLVVTGPQDAVRRHIFVPQHFWQYVALHFGFGPRGTEVTVGQFLHDLVATQVWLAVPVGLLAASLSVWNAERAAGGAEWSPFVRRRQRIDQRTRDRRTAQLLASPKGQKLTAPALGIALDGDLASWRQGRYVVPPAQLRGKAMAVVGAPGAGKTITLLRLAYLAGLLGRKVCFVDCKGTDPTLVPALIAAYRLGNPDARIGCWPEQAMDMWRGSPVQVASRLLAVEQFTEPFYQRVASAGLRLALTAPDMPPVDGSDELLRRLDVDELAALWEGRPLQLKDIEAIGDHLPGARLRYADFFATLAGAFDRGHWSYEDVDLAVLTVPTLLSKSEADAAMRVVLGGLRPLRHRPQTTTRRRRPADPGRVLRPGLGGGQRHQPGRAGPRRRRPGRRRRPVRRGPGRSPPGPAAAGRLRRRGDRAAVPRSGAAHCLGRPGAGPGAQLGAGLLRPPRVRQGPDGGAAEDRPRGRPPGPAGRGLGHPGWPVHPPAGAAPAGRGPRADRAGSHSPVDRRHPAAPG